MFCDKLFDVGCEVLMFWGVLIGMGFGLNNVYGLCFLWFYYFDVFLVVDVGFGVLS